MTYDSFINQKNPLGNLYNVIRKNDGKEVLRGGNYNSVINLINDIKERLNILILFVTHDINSIKDICKNIIILKNGEIIEKGLTNDILSAPKEAYTKRLINSTFKNKIFRT